MFFGEKLTVIVLLAENGLVMIGFWKETVEMMLSAKNDPEMVDL